MSTPTSDRVMTVAQVKIWTEAIQKEQERMDHRMNHLENTVIPIQDSKISRISHQLVGGVILFSINLLLLGFLLDKTFDISNKLSSIKLP